MSRLFCPPTYMFPSHTWGPGLSLCAVLSLGEGCFGRWVAAPASYTELKSWWKKQKKQTVCFSTIPTRHHLSVWWSPFEKWGFVGDAWAHGFLILHLAHGKKVIKPIVFNNSGAIPFETVAGSVFKVTVCDAFLVRPEGQGYFCVQPSLGEGVWGKWMAGHFSCNELRSGENRRLFCWTHVPTAPLRLLWLQWEACLTYQSENCNKNCFLYIVFYFHNWNSF